MPTISIGDADLYYEERGSGPPLLLVPGLNGLGSWWIKQVEDLSRDFRVIVHDHRGTGKSTHSRIRYSVDQMAGDLIRLMDALGVRAAHLIGHSTGGAIGQVIAQDHPERLLSLVLSATWAGPDAFFRRVFESRKSVLLKQGVEDYLNASILFLTPPWWVSANDALIAQQQREQIPTLAPTEVLVSRIDAIMAFDRRARMREIRTPTLVIVATDDMVTPVFYSRELADGIPGAKLVILEGGGHFAPVLTPAPYNAAVGGFVRAVAGR